METNLLDHLVQQAQVLRRNIYLMKAHPVQNGTASGRYRIIQSVRHTPQSRGNQVGEYLSQFLEKALSVKFSILVFTLKKCY